MFLVLDILYLSGKSKKEKALQLHAMEAHGGGGRGGIAPTHT
jgi:hypothetical protein